MTFDFSNIPVLWGGIGGFFGYMYILNKEWENEIKERDTPHFLSFWKARLIFHITSILVGSVVVFAISITVLAPIWQLLVGGISNNFLKKIFSQ
jgi:uncharacterized BrkB/YihY/UPF0761 family membrane protein